MERLHAYLVGGAVRDRLLGRPVQDRDWVVVGSSVQEMTTLGFIAVGKDFPVFLHPVTKEEYALARTERKRGVGHRGFEVDASPDVTLEEDLSRRDLTINAIAESVTGELIDPFNGVRDVREGNLRHVSTAFVEDPLRVFRVARLAAQLPGFTVVDGTQALLSSICASGELRALPAERVWQELEKALAAPAPARFFAVLAACGGLTDWLPELAGEPMHFAAGDAIDRFSELPLPEDPLVCLAARLKAPHTFIQAALNYKRFGALLLDWTACDASRLVDCLVKLKVVHGLEHLDRLLGLLQRHHTIARDRLTRIATGLGEVAADTTLEGKAYGDALRARRIAWVEDQRSR